ncbi:MAG: hypothetical protein M0036_19725 [Desulfobacteraceae bacterium]|nr:hypothetical protein [Desulfobacteraceae bacterium]
MENKHQTMTGFLLGIAVAAILVLGVGAVNSQTQNNGGDTSHAFQSITTSSDGQTVYVCSTHAVFRSTDGGANWTVVLKKGSSSGGY